MGKPRIGIALGDRNGIGPEIVARLLGTPGLDEQAEITVVGHPAVLEYGRVVARVKEYASGFYVLEQGAFADSEMGAGKVSARAGSEALDQIAILLDGARQGEIDGIVFAPVNEDALRLGGLKEDDQPGKIAMQLLKSAKDVTVLAGLPVPITTVGHGTAYDIAGKGKARADRLLKAFRICCEMARTKAASPA